MTNEDALPFFTQFRCGEGKQKKVSGIMKIKCCLGNRDKYSLLEVMQEQVLIVAQAFGIKSGWWALYIKYLF